MRIGIDLGGTKIEIIALNRAGETLARDRVPTPRGDYEATVTLIRQLVSQIEQRMGQGATVGVGIPGAISPTTRRVKNANSTWLNGRPLKEDLEHALGREVRLANDADCFTASEATDGAGAGAGIVFGVIVGTGTGGGIAVEGRLLRGPNAITGEWGHNPLPWPRGPERPGPPCYCGKRGCIETWLSGPALAADFLRRGGGDATAEVIAQRAALGDERARECLNDYADRMARALAGVINVIDPHTIVLGGGLSHIEMLYREVPRLWGRYIFSDTVATRLLPPAHGDSSGVRGAACLWPVG